MIAPTDEMGFFPQSDAEDVLQTGHPKVQLLSFKCLTISMTTSNQEQGEKLETT